MTAKWKEISAYTGQPIDEDMPTNAAGHGAVAGIGVGPDGEPGYDPKKRKKKRALIDARSKAYREHRMRLEKARQRREERKSKLAQKVAENIDNFAREKYIEVELDEKFKVGDKVKVKKGSLKSPSQRHYERTVGTIVKVYSDGGLKVNFGGNDDFMAPDKMFVKEEVELEEVNISDYVVNTLRDIKRSKSARNLKLKGGSVKVDMNTANMMLQVLDKINPMNKKKIMDILDKGTKNDFMKVHGAVMKAIR